jgi:hypothetical protein
LEHIHIRRPLRKAIQLLNEQNIRLHLANLTQETSEVLYNFLLSHNHPIPIAVKEKVYTGPTELDIPGHDGKGVFGRGGHSAGRNISFCRLRPVMMMDPPVRFYQDEYTYTQ